MPEIMQNLIEINAILARICEPMETEANSSEVTSKPWEVYEPIDGVTYL